MYEGWMPALAHHGAVLAIDTPGYGASDALPHVPSSLADYVPPLHALLQHIAGPRYVIYGSATGAQLAIAYALRQPQAVAHVVLDNAAHFEDGERQHMLAHYFPDLTPQADGSHWHTAWRMARQMALYFPWFEDNEAHRVSAREPSAAEIHTATLELLNAGPHYAAAYRAAFEHERAEHVQALTVPTTVLRWQGSILLKHIDRLLAHAMPSNVKVHPIPADMAERFAAMGALLQTLR
jgi:pimeloyl-ACP methyl ester carboxylesterase